MVVCVCADVHFILAAIISGPTIHLCSLIFKTDVSLFIVFSLVSNTENSVQKCDVIVEYVVINHRDMLPSGIYAIAAFYVLGHGDSVIAPAQSFRGCINNLIICCSELLPVYINPSCTGWGSVATPG